MALDIDELKKPARKVRKLLKSIGDDPAPEQVHHLRTNTRRLEASLDALSSSSRLAPKHLTKVLKRIRKRAGKVRDMDVLTSYVLGLHLKDESLCTTRLLEYLASTRNQQAKKLHKLVSRSRGQTRKDLKTLAATLQSAVCESPNEHCDPARASVAVTASALELETKLASGQPLNKNNLHPYRLVVKELRNVLRMSWAAANQEFVYALGDVKDSIGEWHDWEELRTISEKVLDHGFKCQLLKALERTSRQKYKDALSRTEQMRGRYLGIRRGRKSRGLKGATDPVWKATEDLAA